MALLIVHDQHPVFLNFINGQLSLKLDPATTRTIAHVRMNADGSFTMLAVVAFDQWTEHSVEMSIASMPGMWATRSFIRACYDYAFVHAGKVRVHMAVEPSNTAAVEMHERLGHKYEGRLEDWFGVDRDALIYGLTKRNYLKGKWALKENKNNE